VHKYRLTENWLLQG